jgi:cytidylate kinase
VSIITIEGRAGAGGPPLGRIVARTLDLDFLDRLAMAEIARRVGATVEAVQDAQRRTPTRTERLAQLVQRMLERSSVAGSGGDPYFGPGIETLMARPYRDMEEPPATTAQELDERHFIDTTAEVIRDIAEGGNAVILSRGAGAILRDRPDVLRVCVLGKMEDRARRIFEREHLPDMDAALEFVEHSDRAQARYFEKAFETSPLDPFLYHVMWNTSEVSIEYAATMVTDAARTMVERGLR